MGLAAMSNVTDAHTIEGLEEAHQKILKFVSTITSSTEVEGLVTFELYQHGAGIEEEDPVYSAEHQPGDNVSSIANDILEAASEDAGGYTRGVIKYVLRAEGIKARVVFTLRVNSQEDEDLEDIDELPNKKGLLSQLMRHQEKIMRIAVGSFSKTYDMTTKLLREKDDRISQLEKGQIDTIKMVEDLMSGRFARDIELRKISKEEDRKDAALSMLMQSLPMLANKFLGGQAAQMPAGAVQGPTPLENMVEGLMSSLTQEQFQQIIHSGVFKPEQIMTLAEIARAIQARQDAANAANAQKATSAPSENSTAEPNKS